MIKDIIGNQKSRHKEKLLRVRRDNLRKNKIAERQRKIQVSQPIMSNSSGTAFRTNSALYKAIAKAKSALPKTLEKQKAVIIAIFNGLSENTQMKIVLNNSTLKSPTGKFLLYKVSKICKILMNDYTLAGKKLSKQVIDEVVAFYERDNVSRMSPNVNDARKFTNISTGKKEVKQIRHLLYPLKEVYFLFIEQFYKNGE